ncbi:MULTISPECIES: diaminobutyrate acetyltransferase [Nocardia]|uniref:L-2,4-diaminobutyric acid acetyltransferase n=1 Tax=Nocardia farcinica TaxID=37329 RepID=A0A0H5NI06_NOCFR|nr:MULTISPECIES: diaminobutyrate acetyltransferase [Nocardia]MCZ9326705.1 diaminobutyrate acetyltransferase [Nocardia farcinica]PFX04664.1 L-2,4-diaminobutyric acid acetyltransferase [Nocardia farcinica]PFX09745.1 L-2,4-diaminobutyric acid acetyltransferase [Nocardia farcinica]UEX25291.1 diaminobutyrate acetyltransferase [Nocardia farcinica]CRY75530.1 L-2%2C4-diaminobutyric acid acetyltransferase [Nocardia farcinica]
MSLQTLSTPTAEPVEEPRPVEAPWQVSDRIGTALLRAPQLGDAAEIWRIAKDSRVLDTNSSYAYLLWCRDFPGTTVVAEVDGRVVGFVIGYLRPESPDTVFVWQVAVSPTERGRGTGTALIQKLLDRVAPHGVTALETTISPDNPASIAMFAAVARRRGAQLTKQPLFDAGVFPDEHAPEDLYRIAPIAQEIR